MNANVAEDAAALALRLRTALAAHAHDTGLQRRARWLGVRCLIGIDDQRLLLDFRAGHFEVLESWPPMTSWHFALQGSVQAWSRYWQSPPPPGWHDLLALAKRGELRIEGELHPFMAHLQYFKDLLALPRAATARVP